MDDDNVTRPSLLIRLRNSEDSWAWSQFVEIYSPLIFGFTLKRGLQDADARDVTQEVLRLVARSIGGLEYDRDRGSFRGWLFTIVRNVINDWIRQQHRMVRGAGSTTELKRIEQVPEITETATAEWEIDHQRYLFEWAAKQVRAEVADATWAAFWKTTIENQSGHDTAQELGMTVAAVYLSKSRIMARIRDLVRDADQ